MNNDHLDELDILLYDKMPHITDNILNNISNDNKEEHIFSEEFESKMNKLIKEHEKKISKNKFSKYLKIASISTLIILLSNFFNVVSHAGFRDIINIFTNVFSTHTSIEFSKKTNSYYIKLLKPSYIPKGYKKIEEAEDKYAYEVVYKNSDDLELTYTCKSINSNTFIFDTENADVEDLKINGENAKLINKNNLLTLYYKNENWFFIINADFNDNTELSLLKKDIIKLAESTK